MASSSCRDVTSEARSGPTARSPEAERIRRDTQARNEPK